MNSLNNGLANMIKYMKLILIMIATLFLNNFISFNVNASVVMTGTRVIYNEGSRSVDVDLSNDTNIPYVIQTWFDKGVMTSGPDEKIHVPFVATPAIFRMNPNGGQVLKITYLGDAKLPTDKESVFYFNFIQIPPSNLKAGISDSNKMFVVLRNRVKLFYRPSSLLSAERNKFPDLTVTQVVNSSSSVSVKNNTPFYVTISDIYFLNNGKKSASKAGMIAPFGSEIFNFPKSSTVKGKTVNIIVLNDQGARINENYSL